MKNRLWVMFVSILLLISTSKLAAAADYEFYLNGHSLEIQNYIEEKVKDKTDVLVSIRELSEILGNHVYYDKSSKLITIAEAAYSLSQEEHGLQTIDNIAYMPISKLAPVLGMESFLEEPFQHYINKNYNTDGAVYLAKDLNKYYTFHTVSESVYKLNKMAGNTARFGNSAYVLNLDNKWNDRQLISIEPEDYRKGIIKMKLPIDFLKKHDVYFLPYNTPECSVAAFTNKKNQTIVLGMLNDAFKDTARIENYAAHELGHQIQWHYFSGEDFSTYKKIRGIDNDKVFSEKKEHRFRPSEIFAEDIRVLFSGEEARTYYHESFYHDDVKIEDPRDIPGLREFILSVVQKK